MKHDITAIVDHYPPPKALITLGSASNVRKFNYGASLSGIGFREIYVNRPPRSLKEEAWYNEQLHTRLTPMGKIIHGY